MDAMPDRSPEFSPPADHADRAHARGTYAYRLSAWAVDAAEVEYHRDVSGHVEAASETDAIEQAVPELRAAMADWPSLRAEHAEIQIEALDDVGAAD